jgi:hypothetical protein
MNNKVEYHYDSSIEATKIADHLKGVVNLPAVDSLIIGKKELN